MRPIAEQKIAVVSQVVLSLVKWNTLISIRIPNATMQVQIIEYREPTSFFFSSFV
jgi:hypothetical protein